ncbi:hypothetical protein FRD01_16290 [Microvenator marinus]|jgi:hypothetical protein|uniref:Microcin J25-processing protein McjB C-terminal domain-containing protein n=1 Tax=Microvenator marinus TaxID=2600177 RepID=A0A5B8XV02_9DELT|nr:lasso peptide biosynthesis protein [Microvenator marinus]QED28768.1 hypothetical protein FRD01_16290 [Microvenator marinus]
MQVGVGLLLVSATVLNRYGPGELLRLEPADIGTGRLDAESLAKVVSRVADSIKVLNCLPRAIVLREILRQNGVVAEVVISATYLQTFQGHAWVRTPHGNFFNEEGLQPWIKLPLCNEADTHEA